MTKKGIPIFIFSMAAAAAAAVIRFFLYVTAIDFQTGFYTVEGGAAALFFRGLLLLAALAFSALCFFGERRGWTAFTVSSDGLGTRTTLVLGGLYLVSAAVMLFSVARAGIGVNFSVLSVIELIGFAAVGLLMMKSSAAPTVTGLIQVALSLSLFFRALNLFNSDLVIGNRSDSLLLLLSYVFGSLFFAAAARCYARLETKHSRLRELILAGLTFLFAGTSLLSKLLAALFGGTKTLGVPAPDPTAVSLALISLGFLASLCFTEQRKAIVYLAEEDDKKKKASASEEPSEAEERAAPKETESENG